MQLFLIRSISTRGGGCSMIPLLTLCSLDCLRGMVDVYNYIIRVVNILTLNYLLRTHIKKHIYRHKKSALPFLFPPCRSICIYGIRSDIVCKMSTGWTRTSSIPLISSMLYYPFMVQQFSEDDIRKHHIVSINYSRVLHFRP